MGKSKKHTSKRSKEVFGIAIVSKFEENQAPEFDEAKYEIWESIMKVHLQAQGYDVWHSIVAGDTSIDESRRYNTKTMNVILGALPEFVKAKVDQFLSAKNLWKKLHDLYSSKHAGQAEDDDDDCDLDKVDEEEEAIVDMKAELISALCHLNKASDPVG